MSKVENIREWMYVDKSGTPKGPVPTAILIRLLDKGLGVSGDTMAWKTGMDMWKKLVEIEEFRSLAEFQEMKWYYLEADGQQRGPISSRLLLHKIKSGDIDGLTMVFTPSYIDWKKLSDIDVLREAMHKIAREEEESAKAMAMIPKEEQVFDIGEMQNFVPFSESSSTSTTDIVQVASVVTNINTEVKSTFVADNGIRYTWDNTEQSWVEDDNEDDDDDEDGDDQNRYQQRQHRAQQDDDEEEEDAEFDNEEEKKTSFESNGKGEEEDTNNNNQKKKRKRKARKKTNASLNNHWVYITGLPKDVTIEEVKAHFSKVGLIAINPLDQQPKIKIYKDSISGEIKGDCSICYNAEESVIMAIEVLHEGYLRPNYQLTVTKADFQEKLSEVKSTTKRTKSSATRAQVKVAQSAMAQALAWNEEDDIGISKKQGLKIIVLEGMFQPSDFKEESFSNELEQDVANGCQSFGEIEKITVFSKNPKGIVIVKFKTTFAAQECIKAMDGRYFGGRKLKSYFWDGSTNYSVSSGTEEQEAMLEKEDEQRIDEFGDWLDKEQEDLPEEFKLRKE